MLYKYDFFEILYSIVYKYKITTTKKEEKIELKIYCFCLISKLLKEKFINNIIILIIMIFLSSFLFVFYFF